jgi:short-subunit dehydrogenase
MSGDPLAGRVALVTGASSGIGLEIARQLAPVVRTLILVARRRDRLDALAAEIAREGLTVKVQVADLVAKGDLESVTELAAREEVEILVNNAGFGDLELFERASWDKLARMIDLNVFALSRLAHAVIEPMVSKGFGRILNVGSTAGFQAIPFYGVYGATKAYVSLFSETLQAELRGTGVTVTALCPGPVETEFLEVAGGRAMGIDPPKMFFASPGSVARSALRAVRAGRPRVIPGLAMWIAMLLSEVTPAWVFRVLLLLGRRMIRKRRRAKVTS